MALSIAATTNRLSTVLNDNLSPTVAETISLSFSLWLGFMLCGFSILMACILSHIDKKKERFLRNQNNLKLQTEEKFNIKDIKNFSFSFWLLALNCTFVYAAVYCFNNIASNLFQKRFGYSTVEAGHIISITYIICALFCPVIGVLLDKYGQRVYFIMISGLLVCLSHVLFFSTADSNKPIAPILYMIPIGLGFSINTSVVWSSISYVVEKGSGTAYGIILAMINTGLVVIPILVGYIEENTSEYKGYYWVSVLLAVISAFGVLNSLILFCVNKRSGGKLFARTPLVTF